MNLIFKNKSIVKSRISYLNKQIAKTFFNKNFQLDETMQSVKLNYLNTNTPENKELKLAEDTLPLTERTINNQLTRAENLMILKQQLQIANKQTEEETDHKMRIKFAMFILLIGLFSLWVPLYRTICESQGFSVKTNHTDYKFDGKKLNVLKKYTVKFIDEVDVELPWEFKALHDQVVVNAGETALIFYRAKNKTDKPIIGLSVYDIHPQGTAFYFNKIQCFCFENQMLGPYEEVDLPVFFYIDPAILEDEEAGDYTEMVLKYTFYYAKRQDLARVMQEHLEKEKADMLKLKNRKIELNEKYGRNYKIDDTIGESGFTGLPGVNPNLVEYYAEDKSYMDLKH